MAEIYIRIPSSGVEEKFFDVIYDLGFCSLVRSYMPCISSIWPEGVDCTKEAEYVMSNKLDFRTGTEWMYDQYSFQVIPVMGQLIVGQWKPYQYLVESIHQFPNQEDFKYMIEDAGFCHVGYENLSFGVVAIHSGFKL